MGAIWFVTGVGTDVGKTVATAGLSLALRALRVDCRAVKAVQTGCARRADGTWAAPDAEAYASTGADVAVHAPFCFEAPCSPHLAARLEGRSLDAAAVCRAVRPLAERCAVTLVEGAGGLLVPLGERETVADLVRELDARVVLVVANRLGAINETLLTLEAAENRGLTVEAVIFSTVTPGVSDSGLDAAIRRDNVEFIRERASPALMAELGFVPGLDDPRPDERRRAWRRVADSLSPIAKAMADGSHPPPDRAGEDLAFDARHLWHPYAPTHPPTPVRHAASTSGNRIRLSDGRELIDGMSSWWAAVHGYNHPRLLVALRRQAGIMPHVMFGGFTHGPAVELGRRLVAMMPPGLDRVFFADSGSVAVEAAMKMALQYHYARGEAGRTKFLAPLGGYHGDTQGAMSVCDPVNGMHGLFAGTLAQQLFAPRPACRFDAAYDGESARRVAEILERRGGEIAAFIAEPVAQGAGGMWFYHPEYLRDVRALCDRHGVLLILDEIATGFGRTGRLFASEWAGVVPDILCLGKALTGGMMTLAAVVTGDGVAEAISREGVFMHGPTFMANPLACAVAGASLDLLAESDWRGAVARLEAALRRGLEPCRALPGVADVRVLGAIGVVEMERPVNAERLQRFFVDRGVWIRPFARLVYLMPPYVTDDADAAALAGAVVRAVEEGEWR